VIAPEIVSSLTRSASMFDSYGVALNRKLTASSQTGPRALLETFAEEQFTEQRLVYSIIVSGTFLTASESHRNTKTRLAIALGKTVDDALA
jgi:hypothetical protein